MYHSIVPIGVIKLYRVVRGHGLGESHLFVFFGSGLKGFRLKGDCFILAYMRLYSDLAKTWGS